MTNMYWELFYRSGKIEQYLNYRSQMDLQIKGNDYAGSKSTKNPQSQSSGN